MQIDSESQLTLFTHSIFTSVTLIICSCFSVFLSSDFAWTQLSSVVVALMYTTHPSVFRCWCSWLIWCRSTVPLLYNSQLLSCMRFFVVSLTPSRKFRGSTTYQAGTSSFHIPSNLSLDKRLAIWRYIDWQHRPINHKPSHTFKQQLEVHIITYKSIAR